MRGKIEQNKLLYSNSKRQLHFQMRLQQKGDELVLRISLLNSELDQIHQTIISEEVIFGSNKKQRILLSPEGIFDHLSEKFHQLQLSPKGLIIFQIGRYKQQQTIRLQKKSNIMIYRDLRKQISQMGQIHLGELCKMQERHRLQLNEVKDVIGEMKVEVASWRQYRQALQRSGIGKKIQQMQEKSINQCNQLLNQQIFHHLILNNEKHHKFQAQVQLIKKEIKSLEHNIQFLKQRAAKMEPQCKELIRQQMQIFIQDNQYLKQQIKSLKLMETSKGQPYRFKEDVFNTDILQIHPDCRFYKYFQLQKLQSSLLIIKHHKGHQEIDYSQFISKLAIQKKQIVWLKFNVKITKQYNIEIGVCSSSRITETSGNIGYNNNDLMCFLWEFIDKCKKGYSQIVNIKNFVIQVDTIHWTIKWFVYQQEVPFHEEEIPQILRQSTLYPAIHIFHDEDAIELGYANSEP